MGIDIGKCVACLTDPHLHTNDPDCQECLGAKGPVGVGVHHEKLSVILKRAGFRPSEIPMATGVVLAESSGQANAESDNPDGGTNVGLFQIDCKAWPQYDCKKLHDPNYNASAAHDIYVAEGRTFRTKWSTAASGKARPTTQDPTITWSGENSNAPGDPAQTAVDAASTAVTAVDDLSKWIMDPSSWLRGGKLIVGGALVVLGAGAIVFMVANKANATPVGRAVKTARRAGSRRVSVRGSASPGAVARSAGDATRMARRYGGHAADYIPTRQ